MKIIGVQFSEVQVLKIDDVVGSTGISKGKVARAAMHLGMQKILSLADVDINKAKELVLINDAKSRL